MCYSFWCGNFLTFFCTHTHTYTFLFFVNFTSCTPVPSSPPPLIPALHRCNLPPRREKIISFWKLWYVTVCSTMHILSMLLCSEPLIAVTGWSGKRPLASAALSILHPHGGSSQIACPVSRSSCSFGSVGLAPPCTPAVHRWGRLWGGPIQAPRSGPESYLSWSALLLPQGRLSCNTLQPGPSLPCAQAGAPLECSSASR